MAKRKNKYKDKNHTLLLVVVFIVIFGLLYVFFEIDIGSQTHSSTEAMTSVATTNAATTELGSLLPGIEDRITKSNIYLNTYWSGGFEFGSGVIIDEDDYFYYAITNEHVIDGDDNMISGHQVTTYDEVTSYFELIASSEELDLALIKFEKSDHDLEIEPLQLEQTTQQNNLVLSIGNPYANIGTITYGFIEDITTLNELELEHQVLKHSCPLYRGSSGGALVNDDGFLIGINTWELDGEYYAIRSSVVQDFINNNL